MATLGRLPGLLPSLSNPFASSTVDRSAPAVLAALEDVAEFKAATANYSVIVDIEEDVRYVPAFVKGERTVFMAVGSVDAGVDFSALDASAVTVAGDTVTVHLPEARLSGAVVDPEQSRVVSRDRGVVDRIGSVFTDSPTGERALYLAAREKLDRAASADESLGERAEQNTRDMLQRLLRPLGFDNVDVTFTS
ncbi:MAG TPA: DUF4230 domain-containing protein [Acidimicrobiales bacterium]|nr:DUF4230 domain-containing protein [Acidimicrobiales bacterium]